MPGHSAGEREYATLVAELRALDEDIAGAKSAAPRATHPGRLDLRHEARLRPARGEHVGLPDGGEIVIRAIEPGDAAELAHAYDQMSALSRLYITRGVPGRPAPAQLADVTHVEPGVHEALVALDRDGRGIGVARYARHPDDPRRAEVFCAVLDRWQRRGVGSALVERLAARAAHAGIERLEARVALGDEAPRRLLAHIADEVAERRDGGTVEITAKPRG